MRITVPDIDNALTRRVKWARITSIDYQNDTADVTVLDENKNLTTETLSAVPIFYHCDPDAKQRSSGALEHAAKAFRIDDDVYLKFMDGPKENPRIIGRLDGLKPCDIAFRLMVFLTGHKYFTTSSRYNYLMLELKKTDVDNFDIELMYAPILFDDHDCGVFAHCKSFFKVSPFDLLKGLGHTVPGESDVNHINYSPPITDFTPHINRYGLQQVFGNTWIYGSRVYFDKDDNAAIHDKNVYSSESECAGRRNFTLDANENRISWDEHCLKINDPPPDTTGYNIEFHYTDAAGTHSLGVIDTGHITRGAGQEKTQTDPIACMGNKKVLIVKTFTSNYGTNWTQIKIGSKIIRQFSYAISPLAPQVYALDGINGDENYAFISAHGHFLDANTLVYDYYLDFSIDGFEGGLNLATATSITLSGNSQIWSGQRVYNGSCEIVDLDKIPDIPKESQGKLGKMLCYTYLKQKHSGILETNGWEHDQRVFGIVHNNKHFQYTLDDLLSNLSVNHTQEEQDFLTKINDERSSQSVGALAFSDITTVFARIHAKRMADQDDVFHSDFENAGSLIYETAENVGSGADVNTVHQGFVDSPPHYANMINGLFSHIGIGVEKIGNWIYTCHVFSTNETDLTRLMGLGIHKSIYKEM